MSGSIGPVFDGVVIASSGFHPPRSRSVSPESETAQRRSRLHAFGPLVSPKAVTVHLGYFETLRAALS